MPLKGCKVSAAARENMRKAQLGRTFSKESKKKMSDSAKRRPPMTAETKKKLSDINKGNIIWKGRKHSEETKKKLSILNKGRKRSFESIRKQIIALSGRKRPQFSDEWKKKISRAARIQRLGQVTPAVGLNESILLDAQEKIDRNKIRRNYHIRDLGYTVDGYCQETNTVYEVYEKYHDRQVQKDLKREFDIRSHLNCCNFIIIHDRTH